MGEDSSKRKDNFLFVGKNKKLTTGNPFVHASSGKSEIAKGQSPPSPPSVSDSDCCVTGKVTDMNGLPMTDVTVVAYLQTLRQPNEIGRGHTDPRGMYSITYRAPVKDATPGLQFHILDAKGKVLFVSQAYFHVACRADIPIPLGGPNHTVPSEFLSITQALSPLLLKLKPEELLENEQFQDISFLTGETGLDRGIIALFSIAARLAHSTELPAELFYGLFRQNVPADATVIGTASVSTGMDLDSNAQRLLKSALAASADTRAKAIDSAIAHKLIPPSYANRSAKDLAKLASLAVTVALSDHRGMGKTSISTVFDSAGIAAATQQKFITLYIATSGPSRRFWRDLYNNPDFTKQEVATLRFCVNVGRFTSGHMPLINLIMTMRQQRKIKGARDLARLSATDWKNILSQTMNGTQISIPANLPGKDQEEAMDLFAHLLEMKFARAYPTTAFSSRLRADTESPIKNKDRVVQFLDSNLKVSLLRTNIDRYLKDNPTAAASVDAETRSALMTCQRMLKLTSVYSVAKPLFTNNIHSAQQIYAMGRDRFVAAYKDNPDMGASQAARIYAKASQTYALALTLLMNNNAHAAGIDPAAIAGKNALASSSQPLINDFPNLVTLFGSTDMCFCSACTSVFSASAYMVDLLHFLDKRFTNDKSAKQVLFDRRPDLAQIELTCQNTNTLLPYIDLVNELLEDAVSPPPDPAVAARRRQTTLSTDELNANPQWINIDAYTNLSNTIFPWILPFDLSLNEAHIYLGQLGTDRVQLMRTFQKPADDIPSAQARTMAIEGLGLTSMSADIITGGPLVAGHKSWDYWNLTENGNSVQDPVDHTITITGTWIEVLSHVRILLDRSGLSYLELIQLLNTVFINEHASIQLSIDPSDSCDLSTMTIVGLTPDVLDRIHRFVRLMRILAWDVFVLDTAIMLLQPGASSIAQLNNVLLRQLNAVKVASRRFQLPIVVAVALFARIETRDIIDLPNLGDKRYSLYHNLFQNLTVSNPVDPTFQLNSSGTEIEQIGLNPQLKDHHSVLQAAFGISDTDLILAINSFTNGKLNLSNLSTLYRHIVLGNNLRVTIKELVSLKAIIERELNGSTPLFETIDPFDGTRPELLGIFCDAVDQIRRTSFSIEMLDYLLRHVFDSTSGVAPDTTSTGTLLKSIRDDLIKIAAENTFKPDPTGTEIRQRLSTIVDKPNVDAIMAILDGSTTLTAAMQNALINGFLGNYVDVVEVQTAIIGGAALPSGQQRYEYMLNKLLASFRRTLGKGSVVQQLSDALGLPIATVANLVTSWLHSQIDNSRPLIEDFLSLPGLSRNSSMQDVPITPDETGFSVYFTEYAALDKVAKVLSGFGFTNDDVEWMRINGITEGWLNPSALPLTSTSNAQGRFIGWSRLIGAADIKRFLPSDGTPFTVLMDLARSGASKAAYFDALSKRTQWPVQSLNVLAGDPANIADQGLLSLRYPDDYRSERSLVRLIPAFKELRRLGISANNISDWIGPTVSVDQADAIKQSVKAKFSNDQWPSIAKPLRDVLRRQQRNALVGYLLAHRRPPDVAQWHDPDDVYAWFLIDVQMDACQGTSRIVQANSSIQLFVQRCMLNLEPQVVVDTSSDKDWLHWKWISRYRVWEANRKVFLYPENWIEPSLRTDKSPFFKDLENDLVQNAVTKDTAEDGLRSYLEKLDAISHLQVEGFYFQASPSVLHVVARKQGNPPVHYYRQWIDSSHWTAWTKVDLDIVSDHVMPIVWKRRLFLFWAIITRQADQKQNQPTMKADGSTVPQTEVHLKIQLAWSEYKGQKWLPKQTAPQTIVVKFRFASIKTFEFSQPFLVTLKSSIDDSLLRIDMFADAPSGPTFVRTHFAEFVLGGVGKAVEAFVMPGSPFTLSLSDISPDARGIGDMSTNLYKYTLLVPTNSSYDAMTLTPDAFTNLSPERQRVAPLNVTYDLYGSLQSEVLLSQADRYKLIIPHQILQFDSTLPSFYEDANRSYFIIPTIYYQNGNYFTTTEPTSVYQPYYRAEYEFKPFYHPFAPLFINRLNSPTKIDALFARDLQLDPAAIQWTPNFDFEAYYRPIDTVNPPYPTEGVDFEYEAGYAIYNWELFYHAPFEIGEMLADNQQFADAKHWYEYIFNPMSTSNDSSPQRYWITKPFYQMTADDYKAQRIQYLMNLINVGDPTLEREVAEWQDNPFEPHIIARWRPVAYQRAIVMKYIDNLIAWGDQLFSQDTMESVNEATQLYVLASELLGPKPEIVIPKQHPEPMTYADLEPSLDSFSNAVAAAENLLAPVRVNPLVDADTPQLPLIPPLYFCIPPNDKLLGYWDTVGDRLFKIRHCMNIQGIERQLALFAPPIDLGLLIRAAAAGLDLSSILNDTSAALPPYRFHVIVRDAIDLCQNLASFGTELLSCLEKRDAEGLALLRSSTERKIEQQITEVHQRTIDHATQQKDVLDKAREISVERQKYFSKLKGELMNNWEITSMALSAASTVSSAAAAILYAASGAAHSTIDVQFGASGAGGSPHATVKIGGSHVGRASANWAAALNSLATVAHGGAEVTQLMSTYNRRKDENEMQYNIATKEINHIDSQKMAAEIQVDIATKQRVAHDITATLAEKVDDYLHQKFTNKDLYEWMISQVSATYFQSYQLAYTVAKRAEQCFRRELGLTDSSYIQFGYWDSLKKGLLSADKLLYDLKRMQAAYFAQNARELEITKNFSLVGIDPYALIQLRSKGECIVTLPELLFDLENPGHYMRRIKTVGVTVPCIVGPYSSVSITLTLLDNHVRTKTDQSPSYRRLSNGDDPRFVDDMGGVTAVVTSHAQNDHGLFETHLADDRYLPFEYAGAISTWKLKLNAVYPQFDHNSITDVILHIQYTARDAGTGLADAAKLYVKDQLNTFALAESRHGLHFLLSARHDYSQRWYQFLNPPANQDQVLTLETPPDRFPFFTDSLDIKVSGIDVIAKLSDPGDYTLVITPPTGPSQTVTMRVDPALNGLHHWSVNPLSPKIDLGRAPAQNPYPTWTIKLQKAGATDFLSLTSSEIEDLFVIFQYEVAP